MCLCASLSEKAVPEMIYTVSGGTLNPTHSFSVIQCLSICPFAVCHGYTVAKR